MKVLKFLFTLAFATVANTMFGQSAYVSDPSQSYIGSGTVVLSVTGSNGYSLDMGNTHYGDVASANAVTHVYNVELYSQDSYSSGTSTHISSCTLYVPSGCTATVNYFVNGNNSCASIESSLYSTSGNGTCMLPWGTYSLLVQSVSDSSGDSGEADITVNINYP
jgi:hypothetical protein